MIDVDNRIIQVLSSSFELISKKETCNEFIADYQVDVFTLPSSEKDVTDKINLRDQIAIHCTEIEENESIDYLSSKTNSWNDFISELQTNNFQKGRIRVHIEKRLQDNRLSIYDIDCFTKYLIGLSFSQFMAVLDEYFTTSLLFEVQDKDYSEWSTNSIAFIAHNSTYRISGVGDINREYRINKARNLCYQEIGKYKFLPEDLFCSQHRQNDPLQSAFIKACIIYTFSFISDYTIIKDDICTYKLNGLRTLDWSICLKRLSSINVGVSCCKLIYEIYQWLYLGGNNNDKINIARNIISLNIDKECLSVDPSVFQSVLSNYKIYEKENVRQYLQVRNKVSELLIDLQEKISAIVDSFIGDFKKNILTLVSFFISVVAIRVVSKGDFVGGFTNEIIGLSVVFLLVSIGLLLYSRWELSKKIDLYNKHYHQIEDRYKDVLSAIELERVFEECDPQKDNTNTSFVLKQKKVYTWLWSLSILLLFLFLVAVLLINNDISIFPIIIKIRCYIQSMFR